MNKTAAIAAACMMLALIWALRPHTPSGADTTQDVTSSRFTLASGISARSSGAFQSEQELAESASTISRRH